MSTLPRSRILFARVALVGVGLCAVALWGCDDDAAPAADHANFGADNSAAWKPHPHHIAPRHPPAKGLLEHGLPQDFSADSATHTLDPDLMGDTLVKSGDTMTKTRDEPHLMDESNTLEKGVPTPLPKSAVPTLGETLSTNLKSTLQPTPLPTPSLRPLGAPIYTQTAITTQTSPPKTTMQIRAAERQRLINAGALPPPAVAAPTPPSLKTSTAPSTPSEKPTP